MVFQSLDLTPGHGNLLGESYWELISPWRGDASTLNTGVSPREENGSSLSRILQGDPPKRYYLTRNLFFALTNSAKLELQETVLQAYQQQIDPNYTPKRSYEEQGILQEVQHQREYYPQPPYPEPKYPDWVNDCDDGMLPMEMGGM